MIPASLMALVVDAPTEPGDWCVVSDDAISSPYEVEFSTWTKVVDEDNERVDEDDPVAVANGHEVTQTDLYIYYAGREERYELPRGKRWLRFEALTAFVASQAAEADQLREANAVADAEAQRADILRRAFETLKRFVLDGMPESATAFAREFGAGKGGVTLTPAADGNTRATGWAIEMQASAMADHLDRVGAKNHCAWTVSMPDGRRLDLTAQWVGAVSIVERMARADAARDEALAVIADAQGHLSNVHALDCEHPDTGRCSGCDVEKARRALAKAGVR